MAFGYLSKSAKDVFVLMSSSVGGRDNGEDSNLFAYCWRIDRLNIMKVLGKVTVGVPDAIELINERADASSNDNSVGDLALALSVIHINISIPINLPAQRLDTTGSRCPTLEPPTTQPVYPTEP
jgi:hypothetical protein